MYFKEKYGRWGIVLGVAEGIGKACAFEFARRGLNVVLVSRRKDSLDKLAMEMHEERKKEAYVLQQDLSKQDAAENIIEKTKKIEIGVVNYVVCLHAMGPY